MQIDIRKALKKFIPIFLKARDEHASEATTVGLIQTLFVDELGYDQITEIALEVPIKSGKVDMVIKPNGITRLLIEVKAADTKKLREHHINQAKLYAAEAPNCIGWVLLTSGILWNLYHVTSSDEGGLETDCAFSVDLTSDPPDIQKASDCLALLSKRSLLKDELEEFWEHREALSHKSIGKALFTRKVLRLIRQEIHKNEEVLLDIEDIANELRGFFSAEAKEQIGPVKIYGNRKKKPHHKPASVPSGVSDLAPMPKASSNSGEKEK